MMIKPFQTILVTTRTGCIGMLVYGEKQVYPFLVICVAFRHLGNFRLVYNCNLTFFVLRCDFLRGSVRGSVGGQLTRGSAFCRNPANNAIVRRQLCQDLCHVSANTVTYR